MVYNYCFLEEFPENPNRLFEIAGHVINFRDMTESVNGEVREIRRVDDSHIRLRREY